MLDLATDQSPYASQADAIRQQTLSTIRLVNNILDMARIEADGFHLRMDWLALDEIIGSTLRSQASMLGDRQVQLQLPEEMVLFRADGPLLERVFVNLLENAVKYSGPDADIGIEAKVDGQTLILNFWDSGPGVPVGMEQLVFDKFTRGNSESSIPGVGIGLAICRAIVGMHQGEISVANRPQGGACFSVRLPLSSSETALHPEEERV